MWPLKLQGFSWYARADSNRWPTESELSDSQTKTLISSGVPVVMHKSDREKENPMNRCSTMAHGIFAFSSQTVVRPSSSHAV